MMGHYKLNAAGEPVLCEDFMAWARWFETAERIVEVTEISDTIRVSTVFLGLDHNFSGGRPVLWETLVFGGVLDGEMYRYETRLQAVRGHEEMVARVRAQPTRQIDLTEES